MSGRDGARGYVYQALVAVFKCFQYDSWNQIKVEPLTNNDKIDILMKQDEVLIRAIQVKSSINKFGKTDIEKWVKEVKTDIGAMDYELVLISDGVTKPAKEFIRKNNQDKTNHVYIENIEGGELGIEKCINSYILEFLEHYNSECKISVNQIDDIAKRIFAELMKISTNEKWFKKDDLINIIRKKISSNIINEKKVWNKLKSVAIRLIGIFALWLSIFVSKGNLRMCVFFRI